MTGRAYRFRTVWRVPVSSEACWDEVVRALRPGARTWWPGVRVESAPPILAPGASFVLAVRAPLGYRLRMRMRITGLDDGHALAASAEGDLRGSGTLTVRAAPGGSEIVFTWAVATMRTWMTATSWVLRPVFAAGHAAVMRRGERALRRRLRARGVEERHGSDKLQIGGAAPSSCVTDGRQRRRGRTS